MSYKCEEGKCMNITRYAKNMNNQASACYLTTMISTILGQPDNGDALNTLRNFRDGYMANHPETYPILIEYDMIGPKIAKELQSDPINMLVARDFYNLYIKPIVAHIKNEEYGIAILKYQYMTNRLKNFYHIDDEITEKINVNIKTLGKARA